MGSNLVTRSSLALSFLVGVTTQAANYVPNRVLVKSEGSMGQLLLSLNKATLDGGTINQVSKIRNNVSLLRFSTAVSAKEAAAELSQIPGIEWAQPDYIYTISSVTEAPKSTLKLPGIFENLPFDTASGLNDPLLTADSVWGIFKISAPEAWKISMGNESIVVADIDTGTDYRHEDLKQNIWNNPDPSAPDRHGYDFANKDPDPMDDHMHGTHTAGTIGARGNNNIGISGVSPHVSLMPIKFITGEGSGTTADAILSIDYAVSKGARVLSNSWGGPAEGDDTDKALEEAIIRAGQHDVLFVAAAGNDGTNNDETPMFPAAYKAENILSVASSTSSDNLSFFSNYGKVSVDVAAPGSNILSTVPANKYEKTSGTSMACPHVAGLAALMLSVNPKLTALQLKSIIMETVDPISSMSAKIASGGRINAAKAVKRAQESGF